MLTANVTTDSRFSPVKNDSESKEVYFSLLHDSMPKSWLDRAKHYLHAQLSQAEMLAGDLPAEPQALYEWMQNNTEEVGREYHAYLEGRHAGLERRYFTSKAHALYFLKAVAPTKLVDGAWLYGVTQHWQDARFSDLIRIYLEELGEGIPEKNHVALYKKLLNDNGCEQWQDMLEERHYVQGAIQLALAYHAADFLPELIGFNLGYEQLPLHLLISAYELNELGIDPYYFTLHVTVDNAASGHACRSIDALFDAMPQVADRGEFYRRVVNGYKLNMLGGGTLSAIAEFSLDKEVAAVLASKARIGCMMHSDYCRIAGLTVNEWLAEPARIPDFLESLEKAGWIKRHQEPESSRFWKLIQGQHAEMFGVFNAYERQVIHDWIAGDYLSSSGRRTLNFRARRRLLDSIAHRSVQPSEKLPAQGLPGLEGVTHMSSADLKKEHAGRSLFYGDRPSDFNAELRLLEEKLVGSGSREEMMDDLVPLLSPARHHTASGLMATRVFNRYFSAC